MAPSTPYLMIDESIMRNNLERMALKCRAHGCVLRPHIKTHKSVALAKLQMEYGSDSITVAKLSEAEIMAAAGFRNIFMAYPIIGEDKIRRAAELSKSIRLILSTDSLEAADMLSKGAKEHGVTFEIRLEIETGMERSGVLMADALEIAKQIAAMPNLNLTGIYTYRSMIYQSRPHLDARLCGHDEGRIMVELKNSLCREGIAIQDVSVGSTATALTCAEIEGVTEVRPGTYIFYDRMQADKGACDESMFAAFVQVTVVSVKGNNVIIDAGNKSISADCPGQVPYSFKGYGKVLGHDGMILYSMTEEHGMILNENPDDVVRVGDGLNIVPNHICTTVNLYDHAYLVKDGAIKERINIEARGANY